MLIAIWMLLTKVFIPEIGTFLAEAVNLIMPIVIMSIGISILCSIVDSRVNFNFLGGIFNALVRALGYLGRTLISAIGWCLRHIIVFVPVLYGNIRRACTSNGMSLVASNVLAILGTIFFVVIII